MLSPRALVKGNLARAKFAAKNRLKDMALCKTVVYLKHIRKQ